MEEEIILWEHEKFLKNHYSKPGSESKKELYEHLIRVWRVANNSARTKRSKPSLHVPYRLSEFREFITELNGGSGKKSDQIFATYIHFSRRNRKGLQNYAKKRGLALPPLLETIIENCNNQSEGKTEQDIVLDYFLGLPDIAKRLEIIIDCRTLHARLLRKASAIHPRFSDLAEHQIDQCINEVKAFKSDPSNDLENLANIGAYPSSEIENGIELQRLLNNARRCKSYHHNSKEKEMAEVKALRGKIQESQKKDSEIIKLFSNIHIWWTYQLEFREACKSFNYELYRKKQEQMTEYLKEMKPISHEDKYLRHLMEKSSLASIANHPSSTDRRLKKSLFELELSKTYHEKLRNCINGEKSSKVEKDDKTDFALFASIFSGIQLKNTGIYTRVKLEKSIDNYRPVDLTGDYQNERIFGSSLVEDCRHSIRNSLLMFDHIIKKNRHTSSVEIVLVSIDLLLRIRRYLSIPALRKKYPAAQGAKTKEYIKNNHEDIAIEIRNGITHFLTNVIKFIEKKEELKQLYDVFNDWKKYLEEDFAESPFNRNALGTLCSKCGILIGCPLVMDNDPAYTKSGTKSAKSLQTIPEEDYSNCIKDWMADEHLDFSLLLFSPTKFEDKMNQQKEKRASLDTDLKTVKGDKEKEQEIKQEKKQLDVDLRINSAIFFTTNSSELEHYSVYPYLSPAGESTIQEF